MRSVVPKSVVAVVAIVAIVRAATARAPDPGKPITDALAHDAYREITSHERTMRRDAAVKFPGDPWSQDDDFHDRENQQVRAYASSHEVRLTGVVAAIDDGMRTRWPTPVQPYPKVPPCRPRLSY